MIRSSYGDWYSFFIVYTTAGVPVCELYHSLRCHDLSVAFRPTSLSLTTETEVKKQKQTDWWGPVDITLGGLTDSSYAHQADWLANGPGLMYHTNTCTGNNLSCRSRTSGNEDLLPPWTDREVRSEKQNDQDQEARSTHPETNEEKYDGFLHCKTVLSCIPEGLPEQLSTSNRARTSPYMRSSSLTIKHGKEVIERHILLLAAPTFVLPSRLL